MESVQNQKKYFVSIPSQKIRLAMKTGRDFNIMLVGPTGIGKTSFINALLENEVLTHTVDALDIYRTQNAPVTNTEDVESITFNLPNKDCSVVETNTSVHEDGCQFRFTIVESHGLGENLNNTGTWLPLVEYVKEKFNSYSLHEYDRTSAIVRDPRIHLCFYFIEPSCMHLKELDIHVMKDLNKITNLIPVVGKCDLLSAPELNRQKNLFWRQMVDNDIQIYNPLGNTQTSVSSAEDFFPYSVYTSRKTVELLRRHAYDWDAILALRPELRGMSILHNMLTGGDLFSLIDETHTYYLEYHIHRNTKRNSESARRAAEIKNTYTQQLRTYNTKQLEIINMYTEFDCE